TGRGSPGTREISTEASQSSGGARPMKASPRALLAGLLCAAVVSGWAFWVVRRGATTKGRPDGQGPRGAAPTSGAGQPTVRANDGPNRPFDSDVITGKFEDGGFTTASQFMAQVADPSSLEELREAVQGRGRRGIAELLERYKGLKTDSPPTREQT